jgi:hypothetical protein
VQRVQGGLSTQPGYRVVAYPAPRSVKLRAATHSSRAQLLESLPTALPDFDPQVADGDEAQVLSPQEMELTVAQRALLGVAVVNVRDGSTLTRHSAISSIG